jgi:hypothetical protein
VLRAVRVQRVAQELRVPLAPSSLALRARHEPQVQVFAEPWALVQDSPPAVTEFSLLQELRGQQAWLQFSRLLERHASRAGLQFSQLQAQHVLRALLPFSRLPARHVPRGQHVAAKRPWVQPLPRVWPLISPERPELPFVQPAAWRLQRSPGVRRWPWRTKFCQPWQFPSVASEWQSEAYAARAPLPALQA